MRTQIQERLQFDGHSQESVGKFSCLGHRSFPATSWLRRITLIPTRSVWDGIPNRARTIGIMRMIQVSRGSCVQNSASVLLVLNVESGD